MKDQVAANVAKWRKTALEEGKIAVPRLPTLAELEDRARNQTLTESK